MNILLCIQYLGTNYSGWQSQHNAVSIQTTIEQGILRLSGEKVKITGSGRTDAGVHALGQTANFHTSASIPAQRWAAALNPYLPEDICILYSQEVSQDFHARFQAKEKTYLYRIFSGAMHPVLERNRSAFVKEVLDEEAMKEALKEFVGTHDFSAFCAAGSFTKSSVRTVYKAKLGKRLMLPHGMESAQDLYFDDADESLGRWREEGNRNRSSVIQVYLTGDGFLYNMVRILAGTLIEIGKGKEYSIAKALQSGRRNDAGPTAPPWGLYLYQVGYQDAKELVEAGNE